MLDINFDLFYELKLGSVISNTDGNVVRYFRIKDGKLEVKAVINTQTEYDWNATHLFEFPVNGKFKIETRFERFNNG
jgi:hemolysin activation/secretion protein